MRLDYLSVWVDWFDCSELEMVRPRFGMDRAYEAPWGTVMTYDCQDKRREYGYLLIATGEDAELLRGLLGQNVKKVTRADFCFDGVSCGPKELAQAWASGRVVTRAREWSFLENSKGATFNIGRRSKRGYMVRCYDMRGFNRLEYEVHGVRAHDWYLAYDRGEDVSELLAGLVRVVNLDDPRPTRRTIADWFREEVADKARKSAREWQKSIESSLKALQRIGHWVAFGQELGVLPERSAREPQKYRLWRMKQEWLNLNTLKLQTV